MKKTGILNAPLSKIVASMGHTDKLVICDSGFPIPKKSEVVDLALTTNIPRFTDTLKIVLNELQVEEAIVAEEITEYSNGVFEQIKAMLPGIPIKKISHEKFKELTKSDSNVSFVRTGEATPYANIILISGVTFS
jgi:D-ribose pyranase